MSNLQSQELDVGTESRVLYKSLVEILSSPSVLEIEILPSSFPFPADSSLLIDGPALALSKKSLIKAFLVAHSILFSHLTADNLDVVKSPAALGSTAVILLFDPNHITAANFRKRQLLNLRSSTSCSGLLQSSVQQELTFIESLVTSPLLKHTKSSTLWMQRLWVVSTFPKEAVKPAVCNRPCTSKCHVVAFWAKEISIVMKAGERHPKNYYAWHYARRLYHLLTCNTALVGDPISCDTGVYLAVMIVEQIHRWCLQHPRDISGWAFLILLFDISLLDKDGDNFQRQVETIMKETRSFARKYDWSGQSVDWVLKAIARYGSTTIAWEDGVKKLNS